MGQGLVNKFPSFSAKFSVFNCAWLKKKEIITQKEALNEFVESNSSRKYINETHNTKHKYNHNNHKWYRWTFINVAFGINKVYEKMKCKKANKALPQNILSHIFYYTFIFYDSATTL